MSEPVLCYVRAPWAYFTTQPLAEQWGDDWDDAPYEHNAGEPYEWREDIDGARGRRQWTITRIAFRGPFYEPDHGLTNSPFSVQGINALGIPWLRTDGFNDLNEIPDCAKIRAGATVKQFISFVHEHGGEVYVQL